MCAWRHMVWVGGQWKRVGCGQLCKRDLYLVTHALNFVYAHVFMCIWWMMSCVPGVDVIMFITCTMCMHLHRTDGTCGWPVRKVRDSAEQKHPSLAEPLFSATWRIFHPRRTKSEGASPAWKTERVCMWRICTNAYEHIFSYPTVTNVTNRSLSPTTQYSYGEANRLMHALLLNRDHLVKQESEFRVGLYT